MKRWLAVAVVSAMLAVPAVSAAGWLQPRGDAAATGFQPGSGPAWNDTALRVPVPGNLTQPPDDPPPLILEDEVIFVALPTLEAYNGTMSAFSADLSTGELDRIATVPFAQPMRIATDGHTLYLSGDEAVHARPLDASGHDWDWTWSDPASTEDRTATATELDVCASMVLYPEYLTVLCKLSDARVQRSEDGFSQTYTVDTTRADSLVARLDAETGEATWTWRPRAPTPEGIGSPQDEGGEPPMNEKPLGVAVTGNQVVATTLDVEGSCLGTPEGTSCGTTLQVSAWTLDAESGEMVWPEPWTSPPFNITRVGGDRVAGPAGSGSDLSQGFPDLGHPTASPQAIYVKAGDLYKLNAGTGNEIWSRAIGDEDVDRLSGDFATALSLTDDHVYATTAQTVYRIDKDNPQSSWSTSLNFSAGEGFQEDPIVTPERVYAATLSEGGETVYAFDKEDGGLVWQHDVEDELWAFSIGEGISAYTARNTTEETTSLVILGRTEASPATHAAPSTQYPDVGGTVEVDLSDSQAGAQGPVTRYKAIWGDGTETPWQEDPVLNHSYTEPGDHTARFVVGNDANQTNSTTITFHVGQEEPAEPNWVSERFEPENQEMTFGVLGIAMALGGGVIGVVRRKRKKSILQEELETLEEGFEDTRDNPGECEAFLETRKARARSLMMDGTLDEEQFGVIESRIEELGRKLRTSVLDERFQFLPYGLVQSLKKMLDDGKISSWERDAVETLLEDEDTLSEAQREKVRHQLDRWLVEDAGGGER